MDTRLVYQRIRRMSPGEIVTHDELSSILGHDSRAGKGRSSVYSARRMALRQCRYVLEAVRGVGIKRLTDSECARMGMPTLLRVRRTISRGVAKVTAVSDFGRLTRDEQIAHNSALAVMGAIRQATGRASRAKIESAVRDSPVVPSIADTLKLFSGN